MKKIEIKLRCNKCDRKWIQKVKSYSETDFVCKNCKSLDDVFTMDIKS